MIASLAYIFLLGLAFAAVCTKLKLPRIIGMLAAGIILGPYALNMLDTSVLAVSADLRKIALIIILLKAGLSLDLSDLKKVGRPAVMMSFVPACFEILAYILLAPYILGVTKIEAAVMGAVMAAVSPAVVIPRMSMLMDNGYGTKKSIPQLIMAGASCDDIFVIVLFSAFTGMAQGGTANVYDFIGIPISIILGVVLGSAVGICMGMFFENANKRGRYIRNSMKVIIVLGISFILVSVETWTENIIPISGLLAVVGMACAIKIKCVPSVTKRLSEKFGKLWIAAEVILFVLVGAAVDIRYTMGAGITAVGMILTALIFRCIGVFICVIGTELNRKERLFCIISYLPKATVQAAIGAVPLAMGLPCGKLVLSVSVLGILITAPLGAIGIDMTYEKLLDKSESL